MKSTDELPRVVFVAGPTAVGKSSLAMGLAQRLDGELVSIDSVQIYRGLDIGTAKPSPEERRRVRHHLVDELEPEEECNVAEFAQRAWTAIADIRERGKVAIAVGGTNLYVRVLVHGIFSAPPPDPAIRARHQEAAAARGVAALHEELAKVDPALADRVHHNDLVRISRGLEVFELTGRRLSGLQDEHAFKTPVLHAMKIALNRPREELYERINARVDAMMAAGLREEHAALVEHHSAECKPLQALGYRHMDLVRRGELRLEEAVDLLKRDTRRFAKQQLGWLRSEPDVAWGPADLPLERVVSDARRFFEGGKPGWEWVNPSAANW